MEIMKLAAQFQTERFSWLYLQRWKKQVFLKPDTYILSMKKTHPENKPTEKLLVPGADTQVVLAGAAGVASEGSGRGCPAPDTAGSRWF